MRWFFFLVLLAATVTGCSYPYGTLERVDAPMPDVPVVGCNVVDQTGCSGGVCTADVDGMGAVRAECHPSGSSNVGAYCRDHSFCSYGLACWENRDGMPDGTCYAVCFDGGTCPFGTRCDSGGSITATYLGRVAYRCLPE